MSMPKTVSEIMTRDPIALREEDNLEHIAQDMETFHLRHLPVTDGSRLVGLVSHRDLLRFTVSALENARIGSQVDHRRKEDTFVYEVMTRDVETVRPDTPVADAARELRDHKFGCVPVVDDEGSLVGIVTESDMLDLLVRQLESE